MKKKLLILIFSIGLFSQIYISHSASAQLLNNTTELNNMAVETKNAAGLADISVGTLVAQIIRIALSFLAVIFLVLIVMAGFKWMTAGGNQDDIKKSTATIKNAVIGLIVVIAAYTITYFIFKQLPFSGGNPGVQTQTSDGE